jgi:hypothetical protein
VLSFYLRCTVTSYEHVGMRHFEITGGMFKLVIWSTGRSTQRLPFNVRNFRSAVPELAVLCRRDVSARPGVTRP